MRARALVAIALFMLPAGSEAQRIPVPRTGRGIPQPAPLPPEAPAISRALAYKRSRWSAEGYALFSSVQIPGASGSSNYQTLGTGTRGDYRFADHFSATLDITASFLGGSATSQTAEAGTRYTPFARGQNLRPYFDLRAIYTHMHDTYAIPGGTSTLPGGPGYSITTEAGRYSQGLGAVAGAGFEYSITNSIALTSELTALRSQMSTYRLTRAPSVQGNTDYWMTSYRFALGLRFNPIQAMHLEQNPTR